MSCIITYKGKQYSEEQFKEYFINNKNEFTTSISKNKDVIDSFKRKMEAIDGVFKDSPELANIGTKAQYMQYLSTIFKTSKVKDIVYHGTYFSDAFSEIDLTKRNRYFTDTLEYAKGIARKVLSPYILNKHDRLKYRLKDVKVILALLDIKNPQFSNRIAQIMETDNTKDGVIGKEVEDYSNKIDNVDVGQTTTYVVFEPEQIHILGSKQDIEGFKEFVDNDNLVSFQKTTSNKVEEITKKLDDTIFVLTEDEKHYKDSQGELYERISGWIRRLNKKTFEETARSEFNRRFGVDGHADFVNVITRAIEYKQEGKYTTPLINTLSQANYVELEKYAVKLVNTYPDNAKFYLEKSIGDSKTKRAGTMDFFVVYEEVDENGKPTGNIKGDILDWKFTEFKKYRNGVIIEEEINKGKKDDYQKQVREYKRILKDDYGFENTNIKARIIPITINIKGSEKDGYERGSIQIGSLEFNGNKLHLNPIPLEEERTDDETINEILEGLIAQRDKLAELRVSEENNPTINNQIRKLNAVIKETILKKNLDSFILDAINELKNLRENLSRKEIVYARKLINFYKQLNFATYKDNLSREEYDRFSNKISEFRHLIEDLDKQVKNKVYEEIQKIAEEEKIENINSPTKEIGFWSKFARTFSQSEIPKIQALYSLVMRSKDATRKELKEIEEKIQKAVDGVIKYSNRNNIPLNQAFEYMIQRDSKGNMYQISKIKKEIRDTVKSIREEKKGAKDLEKYFDFNEEKFKRNLEQNIKNWKVEYNNKVPNLDTKIKELTNYYEKLYNVKKFKEAYYNPKNFYLTYKDSPEFQSEEYKKIQSTPELKEFYDLFNKFIIESREWLNVDIDRNFIPQILQGYIEQLFDNGIGAIRGFKNTFLDSLTAKSNGNYGEINSFTGEAEHTIPVYFTNKLGEKASTDLGRVLMSWAAMAYNNKNMQEVETAAQLLYESIKEDKIYETNLFGNIIKDESGNPKLINVEKSNNLEAFIQYMNQALYGINIVNKDVGIKMKITKRDNAGNIEKDSDGNPIKEEVTLSLNKGIQKALNYVSGKALGLNFVSASANLFGGIANGYFEGNKDVFYNKAQFTKAIGLFSVGQRNPKILTILRYFDMLRDMEIKDKADSLSVSKAIKFWTYDKLYLLQKGGDKLVNNAILLSIMQSHGLNEKGEITNLRNLPKDTKSLLDTAEIIDDKLVIKGITDNEENYNRFRRKSLEISKKILGNAPIEDIRLANQYIWGRAVMQFRNWIPRMADERFGNLRYNTTLDTFEHGRYTALFNFMKGNLLSASLEVLKIIGTFGLVGNVTQILEQKYELQPEEVKKKISKEDFVALEKGNIKAALLEMEVILALFALIAAAKPDDDEEKLTGKEKLVLKSIERLKNEISFFLLPSSFDAIIKSPIALSNLAEDVAKLAKHQTLEIIGQVFQDEELIQSSKPLKYELRMLPLGSEIGRDLGILYGEKYWE